MRFLKDETGDLVNIALAKYISISPVESLDVRGVATHCVVVIFSDEDSTWLYSGSESDCHEYLSGLHRRLVGIS